MQFPNVGGVRRALGESGVERGQDAGAEFLLHRGEFARGEVGEHFFVQLFGYAFEPAELEFRSGFQAEFEADGSEDLGVSFVCCLM